MQSKSLYNVRTAFKLMQTDLDPLLQGVLTLLPACSGIYCSPVQTCQITAQWLLLSGCSPAQVAVLQANHLQGPGVKPSRNARAGTLQSAQPAEAPVRETAEALAAISRDQMRTADRIIVNVLQKVCQMP